MKIGIIKVYLLLFSTALKLCKQFRNMKKVENINRLAGRNCQNQYLVQTLSSFPKECLDDIELTRLAHSLESFFIFFYSESIQFCVLG